MGDKLRGACFIFFQFSEGKSEGAEEEQGEITVDSLHSEEDSYGQEAFLPVQVLHCDSLSFAPV